MLQPTIIRLAVLVFPGIASLIAGQPAPAADRSFASNRQLRSVLAERSYHRTLDELTEIEFVETPLTDVVDYLEDLHGLQIEIDTAALHTLGIGSDTPITRSLRGISLRAALNIMLRDLELTYLYDNEVMLITTLDGAEASISTRVYPVADLCEDEAAEERLIAALDVALDNAAHRRYAIFRGQLVFRSDPHGHEAAGKLLNQLRRRLELVPPDDDPLSGWRSGSKVDLRHLRLRDTDLECLAGQKQIQAVDLSGTGISDEGLKHLDSLTGLRSLNLTGTGVTDGGLRQLRPLRNLEVLHLLDTQVSSKGLLELKMFPNLRALFVGGAKSEPALSQSDVDALQESLPDCRIVAQRLDEVRQDPFGGGQAPDPFGAAADPFGGGADPSEDAADPFGGDERKQKVDPFGAGDPQATPSSDPFGT